MTRTQRPEWERFKVGRVSTRSNWTNSDCTPARTVSHVTHIEPSITILREGKIRAGLVFDKSKLNTKRILVSWLSPNDWAGAGGFRYGNIRFTYDWRSLIEDKKSYWVESVAYKIRACRILITDMDRGSELDLYDPCIPNGPWWHDKANVQHYFNMDYCLEFMFEEDLIVNKHTRLDFVNHNDRYCSIHRNNPSNCKDLGRSAYHAQDIFLASVVAQSIRLKGMRLTKKEGDDTVPDLSLTTAFSSLWLYLSEAVKRRGSCGGSVTTDDKLAIPLARAVLNAYAYKHNEIYSLSSLFKSKEDLMYSCAKVTAKNFRLSNWESLLEDRYY